MQDYSPSTLKELDAPDSQIQLTLRRNECRIAAREVKDQHELAIDNALRIAKRNIRQFYDSIYGAELLRTTTEQQVAEKALVEEIERLAVKGNDAPWPIGTKLMRIVNKGRYSWSEKKTEYGILEAVTRNTVLPDNLGYWNKPSIGSYIVRMLKTDGTLSKKISSVTYSWVAVDPAIQAVRDEAVKAAQNKIKL